MYLHGFQDKELVSIMDSVTALAVMMQKLQKDLEHMFGNRSEIIYTSKTEPSGSDVGKAPGLFYFRHRFDHAGIYWNNDM